MQWWCSVVTLRLSECLAWFSMLFSFSSELDERETLSAFVQSKALVHNVSGKDQKHHRFSHPKKVRVRIVVCYLSFGLNKCSHCAGVSLSTGVFILQRHRFWGNTSLQKIFLMHCLLEVLYLRKNLSKDSHPKWYFCIITKLLDGLEVKSALCLKVK